MNDPMTQPTTPQARCEQIAREIIQKRFLSAHMFDELHSMITTALLAAEERGSAATDDAWLAALAKAGWKDAASWGDGAEDPSEGRQAICCRIRDELDAAEERGRQEERFRKHDPVAVKVAVDAMWEKEKGV